MILKHFFGRLAVLHLFSNQLALSHNVKPITWISLLDDVIALWVWLLDQHIANLLFFVRINILENIDLLKYIQIGLSLFNGCLLNNVGKSRTIHSIHFTGSLTLDSRSSGSIVHQWQLTEWLTWFVSLQVSLLSANDLGAIVLSRGYDVKRIALFAFLDDVLVRNGWEFFHSGNDSVHILLAQTLEKNRSVDELSDLFFDLFWFGDDSGLEFGLLIVHAETLCADSLPAVFFANFLFLFFFQLFKELLVLFGLIFRPGGNFGFILIWNVRKNITHLGVSVIIDEPGDISRSGFEDLLNKWLNNGIDRVLEIVPDLLAFLSFFFHTK